ncbi:YezD family protein [Novosphingobium clariflavum]|uniref:YezD family protein n=1 Tax=Novosphingobium clariflavum TaxID=2029884 RepID=A0ABV6SB65_9SPHN|nr:YezD family protein [Novosphingobium clariflavum]
MTSSPAPEPTSAAQRQLEENIATVRDALENLRYGNIALTVHDGRVVQIDVTEKKRFQ